MPSVNVHLFRISSGVDTMQPQLMLMPVTATGMWILSTCSYWTSGNTGWHFHLRHYRIKIKTIKYTRLNRFNLIASAKSCSLVTFGKSLPSLVWEEHDLMVWSILLWYYGCVLKSLRNNKQCILIGCDLDDEKQVVNIAKNRPPSCLTLSVVNKYRGTRNNTM